MESPLMILREQLHFILLFFFYWGQCLVNGFYRILLSPSSKEAGSSSQKKRSLMIASTTLSSILNISVLPWLSTMCRCKVFITCSLPNYKSFASVDHVWSYCQQESLCWVAWWPRFFRHKNPVSQYFIVDRSSRLRSDECGH